MSTRACAASVCRASVRPRSNERCSGQRMAIVVCALRAHPYLNPLQLNSAVRPHPPEVEHEGIAAWAARAPRLHHAVGADRGSAGRGGLWAQSSGSWRLTRSVPAGRAPARCSSRETLSARRSLALPGCRPPPLRALRVSSVPGVPRPTVGPRRRPSATSCMWRSRPVRMLLRVSSASQRAASSPSEAGCVGSRRVGIGSSGETAAGGVSLLCSTGGLPEPVPRAA